MKKVIYMICASKANKKPETIIKSTENPNGSSAEVPLKFTIGSADVSPQDSVENKL